MKYLAVSLLMLPLLVSCEEIYETPGPNYHVHPSREVEVYPVRPAPRIITRPEVVIVQPPAPQAHVEVRRPIAPAHRVEEKVVIEAPNAPASHTAPIQRNANVHGHP